MYHFHFDETHKYLQIAYYVFEYLTLICTRIPLTDIKHLINIGISNLRQVFKCFSTIIWITHRCVCDNLLHICVFFISFFVVLFLLILRRKQDILFHKRCSYRISKHVLIYNFILFNILKALAHHYDPIFYDFFAAY